MIRRCVAVVGAVAALVTSCGCDDDDRWSSAPGAPSLLPSWGAREADGKLQIWMGSPCVGVKRISLSHDFGGPQLVLSSTAAIGADVEHITLGGPYPAGLAVTEPWPEGTDWSSAKQLVLQVDAFPLDKKSVTFGASSSVSDIVNGSADHPEDTYWFDGVGWLDKADVAEKDGKTFTAVCTPDPGK